jgi:hypothetical protein
MTHTFAPLWEANRTDETRKVEDVLRNAGSERVDAYRYNSASIRVRVIDSRFEGFLARSGTQCSSPTWSSYPSARRRTS